MSPYAYVGNNPMKYIDPDGRQIWPVGPLLGTNNPVMSAMGRNAIMMSNADKVVRVLPKEEHHLMPRSLKGNEVVKAAREGGFKLEGKENRIPVDKFNRATGEGQHGKHSNYTEQMEKKLDAFSEKKPNFTPEQAAKAVREIISDAKNDIQNNPGTKINDLRLNEMVVPSDNTKVSQPKIASPAQQYEDAKYARDDARWREMVNAGLTS
jgi:ribosomal protein L22